MTDTSISTSDTQSPDYDDFDEDEPLGYGEKMVYLHQIAVVNKYYDTIVEIGLDNTFRLKHTDFDRSAIHLMRNADVIQESDKTMGRQTDWEFTPATAAVLDVLETPGFGHIVLNDSEYICLERHAHLLEEFPVDPRETFQASEYGLNGSLLGALRRNGFLIREEKHFGAPDVWRVDEQASRLIRWLFANE